MDMQKKIEILADTKVTVSRLWERPEIHTRVSIQGIQLDMRLDDFLKAMNQELGWTALVTKGQLLSAAERVIDGVKLESAKVV